MHSSDAFRSSPGSDCCRTCGTALAQRPVAGQGTVLMFCPTRQCPLYGLPSWRRPNPAVTIDDHGDVVADARQATIASTIDRGIGGNRPSR